MNVWDILQQFGIPKAVPDPPKIANPYLQEVVVALRTDSFAYGERDGVKLAEQPLARLKAAPAEERTAFVLDAFQLLRARGASVDFALCGVIGNVLRSGIAATNQQAVQMVELASCRRVTFPYKAMLSALQTVPMTPSLKDALRVLGSTVDDWHGARLVKEIRERIGVLVDGAVEAPPVPVSRWTQQVFRDIEDSPQRSAWLELFAHARGLTQASASKKWQAEANALVDKVGRAVFLDSARRWLALGPMPDLSNSQVPEAEADYQKGFVWTLGAAGDTKVAPDLADFALACLRKIPQIGAVSHRVGNACVNALAAMPGLNAVTQLSRLAARVKYDVARRLIEKALEEAAQRNNVSRDDLEAMSVPTFGLTAEGKRIEVLGNCQATLAIEDGEAVLSWSRDGKAVKAPPAEVKSNFASELAELKKAVKELQAVLATLRLRLERQLSSETWCAAEAWRAWYLDHPVTSLFGRRLIWEVDNGGTVQTVVWWNGELVDWAGNPTPWQADSRFRLWHPIRAQVQEVLSWRCWLEDRGVRQPFKQAHREVYLLTDAERQTETWSNRFAGHIVKQHQFAALCRERGWQFQLMGNWDSHNTPYLELAAYKLRVEFDVDFAGGAEATAHGVYQVIGTGRVQYFALEPKSQRFDFTPRTPLRLENIPAVVFSEAMRDADLFVGVTSIGSDPAWGAEREDPHAEYWRRFADGELSTSAENRKTILEGLLPRLAIHARCRLEGRYLMVRGEKGEYRIHLGSGNVIMEPGSRYLCIVRSAGDTAGSLALPFEGDTMLAVILSKAFLLANDKAIKDPTILAQIGG